MSKIEITEAMVERAIKASNESWTAWSKRGFTVEKQIRSILQAALTEPPEVEVTEEMIAAGIAAVPHWSADPVVKNVVRDVYRAMRAKAPKGEATPEIYYRNARGFPYAHNGLVDTFYRASNGRTGPKDRRVDKKRAVYCDHTRHISDTPEEGRRATDKL